MSKLYIVKHFILLYNKKIQATSDLGKTLSLQ